MTGLIIFLIWLCCSLFNILKINQSYTTKWCMENFGIYAFATVLAPAFTLVSLVYIWIIKSWK